MFKDSKYYVYDDSGTLNCTKGMIEVPRHALKNYNDKHYGIFFSVNSFRVQRKIENLEHINAWYCDVDENKKEDTLYRLSKAMLYPSLVVESKNGLHMYWKVKGEATLDNYRTIQKGLSRYFKGDKIYDVTRVMRLPGYTHWKDANDPYLVQIFKEVPYNVYEEHEMLKYFALMGGKTIKLTTDRKTKGIVNNNTVIGQIINYDCKEGLTKLSGTEAVKGDTFEIVDRGSYARIVINGKDSGSWIDESNKIGGYKRKGPSLYQFLTYYWANDNKKIREVGIKYLGIKEIEKHA